MKKLASLRPVTDEVSRGDPLFWSGVRRVLGLMAGVVLVGLAPATPAAAQTGGTGTGSSFTDRLKSLLKKKEPAPAAKSAPAPTAPAAAPSTGTGGKATGSAGGIAGSAGPSASAAAAKADYAGIGATACGSYSAGLSHPKSLPRPAELGDLRAALLSGALSSAYGPVVSNLASKDAAVPYFVDEPAMPYGSTPYDIWVIKQDQVRNTVNAHVQQELNALLVWTISRNESARLIARNRVLALANADPKAISGVGTSDMAAFDAMVGLAYGLDWLFPEWSSAELAKIVNGLDVRMRDFESNLLGTGPNSLLVNPRNPHGYYQLAGFAGMALMAGDQVPSLSRLCPKVVELYLRLTSPWGGTDGGNVQGTAYATWDTGDQLIFWDVLRNAGGIDLSVNPWINNFGRYLAYFQPPGSPSALFGDAAEDPFGEYRARYGKAYVRRLPPDPLRDWYAFNLLGENAARFEMLTVVPRTIASAPLPAGTPNGAAFTSIGWAAMHSDLSVRDRNSVYFKSSPIVGSAAHAHADQNSFVLVSKGQRLLVASGYYDAYGSPHHYGWTKQTVAHNAITFDGGKGQRGPSGGSAGVGVSQGDPTAVGAITQFRTTTDFDIVTGNAKDAYTGDITTAIRSVVFLRPGTVVVFDKMASVSPHVWEWNFHADSGLTVDSLSGKARVSRGGASACLQFWSNSPMVGNSYSSFPVAPNRTDAPRPDQSHGKFQSASPSTSFVSAVVIDIDCGLLAVPEVTVTGSGAVVKVKGKTVTFEGAVSRVE